MGEEGRREGEERRGGGAIDVRKCAVILRLLAVTWSALD